MWEKSGFMTFQFSNRVEPWKVFCKSDLKYVSTFSKVKFLALLIKFLKFRFWSKFENFDFAQSSKISIFPKVKNFDLGQSSKISILAKVRKFRFWPKFENFDFGQSSKILILAKVRKFRFWPNLIIPFVDR